MLWIIGIVFIVLAIVGAAIFDWSDDSASVVLFIGVLIIVSGIITSGVRYHTKHVSEKVLTVLEQNNKDIIASIEPIIEKYINYEKEIYKHGEIDTSEKLLMVSSLYPELKGDQFFTTQMDIVIKNNNEIKAIKLKQATLSGYKFWIFVGE